MTGARKGEVCGMEVRNVHLDKRDVLIQRSYDKETTKGGAERPVPTPAALVPNMEEALERARSKYLFPNREGSMRTRNCDAAA